MSERDGVRPARLVYALTEGIRIGLDSIRANLFRSSLTILGVAIGVVVVVAMAALITGIRGSVAEGIESAGPRNLYVMRFDVSDIQLIQDGSRPRWLDNPPVTMEEVRRLDALPAVRRAVISLGLRDPSNPGGTTLSYGATRITGVMGAGESESWPDYRSATFLSGRNFVAAEVDEARGVAVISRQLELDLFGGEPAVGRRIRGVGGPGGAIPLDVIGVFEPAPNLFEGQVPQVVLVPYTTALRRMKVSPAGAQVLVVPHDDVPLDLAEDQVIAALRSIRALAPGAPNNFAVVRSTQLLDLFDRFTAVFFIVMLALSSVGLLVGGIGVVGIMMISVTERTREIGIRKSVGATGPEILWQFLVEAAVLTFLGGASGLAVGSAFAWAVASFTPVPAAIPLWAIAASLGMAIFTGILFGLIPAARAARMEPVRALRYE